MKRIRNITIIAALAAMIAIPRLDHRGSTPTTART